MLNHGLVVHGLNLTVNFLISEIWIGGVALPDPLYRLQQIDPVLSLVDFLEKMKSGIIIHKMVVKLKK